MVNRQGTTGEAGDVDPRHVVERAFAAVAAGNIDEMGEVFTEACEFWDCSEPTPVRGRHAFTQYMEDMKKAFPDFRPKSWSFVTEGNVVAAQLELGGTHEGEFLGVPGSGREVWWHASAFYTVDLSFGQIAREAYYFDAASLRLQLQSSGDRK